MTNRRALWLVLVLLGCDAKDEAPAPAAAEPAVQLTGADVCKAFVELPVPPHVVTIAASATEGAIKPHHDGTGMKAQVVELRAESGAVEQGQRRIDGITLNRELTLRHDGSKWTIAADTTSGRSEIFYVHKSADHDPRKLFGASVIERYGPKGGVPCELPAK